MSTTEGQPSPNVAVTVVPKEIVADRAVQVLVTLDAAPVSGGLNDVSLRLQAPPGFRAEPSAVSVGPLSGRITKSFHLRVGDPRTLSGQHAALVEVTAGRGSEARVVNSQTVLVDYLAEVSLWKYFLFGLTGACLGYGIRLLLKARESIAAPLPAPSASEGQPPGPITRFVEKHYYWADLMLTIAIALVVLGGFAKGGRPPDAATTWYGAAVLGAGLGILTNNELIKKI
jgi:hypothetical protein